MTLITRELGLVDYTESWAAMRAFTDQRDVGTPDEIWFVEHPPVFTQGLAGSPAHLLAPGDIPVVQSDRGGQVTYHGPGQLVAYVLLDLRRLGLGPRELVRRLEAAIIAVLAHYGLQGQRRAGAPGVYVDEAKIAALGLRVRRQCSYHGLALNVTPDLSPFARINPCGYSGLAVTSLAQLGKRATLAEVAGLLEQALRTAFESPASIAATEPRPEPATPAPLTG
jgi:lipoyl(octanoyl) transferase